jgi:hypothetical protein
LQDLTLKTQIAPDGEKVFYLKEPFLDARFRVPLDRVEVWVDPVTADSAPKALFRIQTGQNSLSAAAKNFVPQDRGGACFLLD